MLYSDWLVCPTTLFSAAVVWGPIWDTTLHLVVMFSWLLLVVTVSQAFLLFNNFDSFENHCLVVYRMSLNRDLSDVVLMVRLRLMCSGETGCCSHHIISEVHAINMISPLMVILITWLT